MEETNPVILLMISVLVILNILLFTFRLSVPRVISLVNAMLKNVSALYSTHFFPFFKLTFFFHVAKKISVSQVLATAHASLEFYLFMAKDLK